MGVWNFVVGIQEINVIFNFFKLSKVKIRIDDKCVVGLYVILFGHVLMGFGGSLLYSDGLVQGQSPSGDCPLTALKGNCTIRSGSENGVPYNIVIIN